jgi:hypothetical protein
MNKTDKSSIFLKNQNSTQKNKHKTIRNKKVQQQGAGKVRKHQRKQ